MGERVTEKLGRRTPLENIHLKYVDDLSMAQAINLKECLITNPDPNPPKPLSYHDRTNHILPSNSYSLQGDLDNLADYALRHGMVINTAKCKVMIFNNGKKYAGMPHLNLPGMGQGSLEVVEKFKLLGVKIQSDLKWNDNTDYICQKGYARLWMLRRLKGLGATELELLDVYEKQVRSVLELAVPVWQPALTQGQSKQIERVQRSAFYVILGKRYENYGNALTLLEMETLETRRIKLCKKFARKALDNPRFTNWFYPANNEPLPNIKTRGSKQEAPRTEQPIA